MRAIITGSEGFIGKHLYRILVEDGHDVLGLDRETGHDIIDCVLPDNFDRVFHLAAQTDARSSDAMTDAYDNVLGSIRIMQHYKDKVVFASSSAVNYQTTPYAISKSAGEMYAKLYGCGIVRFCNIYGDGGRSFVDTYKHEQVVNARLPGNQIRTYAHVDSACEALLVCKPKELRVLGGEDLTVKDVIKLYYPGKKVNWCPSDPLDVIDGRQLYAPFDLVSF